MSGKKTVKKKLAKRRATDTVVKSVWCWNEKWDVVGVFKPTKHDLYILVSRVRTGVIHEDGTPPIEMALIDAYNDEFFLDVPKVRGMLKRLDEQNDKLKALKEEFRSESLDAWSRATKKFGGKESL